MYLQEMCTNLFAPFDGEIAKTIWCAYTWVFFFLFSHVHLAEFNFLPLPSGC